MLIRNQRNKAFTVAFKFKSALHRDGQESFVSNNERDFRGQGKTSTGADSLVECKRGWISWITKDIGTWTGTGMFCDNKQLSRCSTYCHFVTFVSEQIRTLSFKHYAPRQSRDCVIGELWRLKSSFLSLSDTFRVAWCRM